MSNPLTAWIHRYLAQRRFPQLLAITATLFIADVVLPDFIPFIDEIILGLLTLIFANLKKKVEDRGQNRPPPPGN